MGVLKHERGGRRVALATRSLVGRAEGCAVRLPGSVVSGEHAVFFWDGGRWSVRDLGSRNGTLVGEHRLGPAERVFVEAGAIVTFGGESERWLLEDAGPPGAVAIAAATGERRAAEDGLLVLPDASDPIATLSEDRNGRWLLELDGAAQPAEDGARVEAGGTWTLHLPQTGSREAVPTTALALGAGLLEGTVLRFEVSRDEEFVGLSLVTAGKVTGLGGRAYHELLLTLGRARLRDAAAGLPAVEQGWLYVDELLAMLQLDLHHLNVNVYRSRQQLARAGLLDAGALFERRSTTRQIRLGTTAIEVQQG